jgi:hypothetical protein
MPAAQGQCQATNAKEGMMRPITTKITTASAVLLVGVLGFAACGGDDTTTVTATGSAAQPGGNLPQGSEPVKLDPSEFTTEIDNPYWPMTVGSRWVYREQEGGETLKVVVTVTDRTKQIANGVEARVVHDVVSAGGEPIEVTDDYYAQDAEGNIWYLGEETAEYENGKVVTRAGSFEAGVDGAEAGVIMPADPQPGMEYRQEYYKGEAEDLGAVLSTSEQAQVPFGHFTGALLTRDTNPLEPKIEELKLYAKGVGPVLTLGISGGAGREELLSYKAG